MKYKGIDYYKQKAEDERYKSSDRPITMCQSDYNKMVNAIKEHATPDLDFSNMKNEIPKIGFLSSNRAKKFNIDLDKIRSSSERSKPLINSINKLMYESLNDHFDKLEDNINRSINIGGFAMFIIENNNNPKTLGIARSLIEFKELYDTHWRTFGLNIVFVDKNDYILDTDIKVKL